MINLEINSPHGGSIAPLIKKIKDSGIDIHVDRYIITDNPLSKLRMSSILSAIKIKEAFNKPVMPTMSMRDKNKLSLQSSLLGANDFDLTDILVLTGDKAKKDEKGVLEGNSTLLLTIIDRLNQGENYCGRELNPKINIITPYAVSEAVLSKTVKKKMIKKLEFGAKGIITQPVYDIETLNLLTEAFDEAVKETGSDATLTIGFFPLFSSKTANFINDNIPGINVPKNIIEELDLGFISGNEEEIGRNISKRIYKMIRKDHKDIHIMSSNKFEVLKEIIEEDL